MSSCASGATERVRWLLLKDLQILAPLAAAGRRCSCSTRSSIALLVGVALSAGPTSRASRSLNQVPTEQTTVALGGRSVDATPVRAASCSTTVDPIRVKTREEAIEKVRTGEALGGARHPGRRHPEAPGDARAQRRRPADGRGLLQRREPAEAQYVEDTIESTLGGRQRRALRRGAQGVGEATSTCIVAGGQFALPIVGHASTSSGCAARARSSTPRIAGLPQNAPERAALDQVSRFARLGGREPRPLRRRARLDQRAGPGQADGRRAARTRRSSRSRPRSRWRSR